MKEITALPVQHYVRVADLGEFLGVRPDKLQRKLRENHVPVIRLSTHSKQQLVAIEDLKLVE